MIAFNQDTQWCVIMFSLGDLGRKDSPGADRLQKGIFKKTWNLYPRYVIFNLCYGNCKRWSYTLIYSSTSLKDLFMWCALTRLCRLCCYRSRFIIFQQEIRDWVLRHAGQDRCPPLQWKQHWARHSLRKILQGVHTGNYWPRWVSVWMKHCCDPGQTPHTGGDPDLIVLPQRCSVAFAFFYLNIRELKKKLSLKHSTENNYTLDLMHWVFCISLQSVLIQDCWFATALCKQLVQAPVVHLSARWLCVPSPLRRFWHHQEHARPAAATSVEPFPHHIVINKIGVKGICWCLLVFFCDASICCSYMCPPGCANTLVFSVEDSPIT